MAKTVRLLLVDKSKEIPLKLRDPFLEKTVELSPDGEVSKEFAKLLTDEFPFLYQVIDSKEDVDPTAYKHREDFKKAEFKLLFDQLTPEEKKHVCDYVETLINTRGQGSENVFNEELETDNGETNNSSTE